MGRPTDALYTLDGATLTASGASDPIDLGRHTHVWLTLYVKGAVSGTTPSLTVTLEQEDGLGNWLTIKQMTAITSGPNFTTNGVGGPADPIPLTRRARVRWTVTGTTPQFLDVDITLVGR